jgi:hypothetical protein
MVILYIGLSCVANTGKVYRSMQHSFRYNLIEINCVSVCHDYISVLITGTDVILSEGPNK